MSLWQQLGGHAEKVKDLYTRASISIPVRSFLADYIESRPWKNYNVDDPSHFVTMQNEFMNFQEAAKRKIEEMKLSGDVDMILRTSVLLEEDCMTIFKSFNGKAPEFVGHIQNLLDEELKIVHGESEMKPVVNSNGAVSLLNDLEGSFFSLTVREIQQIIQNIDKLAIKVGDQYDYQRLTQEDLHRKTAQFRNRAANTSEAECQQFEVMRTNCNQTLQMLHNQILKLLSDIMSLLEAGKRYIQDAFDCVVKEIDEWKDNQRYCMISGRPPASLDIIERNTSTLIDILISNCGYYIRLQDQVSDKPEFKARLLTWYNEHTTLIGTIISRCFIVDQQPPQVMKKDTRFSASVRIIAGERWGLALKQPTIKVCLINADQAQRVLYALNKSIDISQIHQCGEVSNGEKMMEYSSMTKTVSLNFKNLVLRKLNRTTDRRACELVTEEKFAVYFQCTVNMPYKDTYQMGEVVKTLHAISLPVTVIVHGSQSPAAEATIFWDNCFAPPNREAFNHPGAHPWGQLKDRINDLFHKMTERPLKMEALTYLGTKVLNVDDTKDIDNHLVTWQAFAKDTLKKPSERSFTFWDWMYSCIDLIKKHFLPMWKDDLILGFISKARTEALLKAPTTQPNNFLLRFSDSTQGMISISYITSENVIKNLIYTAKDLQKHGLAERILDPPVYKFLYPNIAKETKFQKYYRQVQEEVPGYERDLIKAHVQLEQQQYDQSPTTPQHYDMISSSEFNDSFLMETMDYDMSSLLPVFDQRSNGNAAVPQQQQQQRQHPQQQQQHPQQQQQQQKGATYTRSVSEYAAGTSPHAHIPSLYH